MTSEKLQRSTYRDPTAPGDPVRSGNPTRAENALDMDQYYRPLERLHGSNLHGWGVASGLSVKASLNSAGVTVLPGVALDSSGQHISLAVGGNAEIGQNADAPGATPTLATVAVDGVVLPTVGLSGDKYVTIQFWETFDTDGFQNLGTFRYFHTPWLRLLDVAGFTNDGSRLVLAKVSLGSGANAGQVSALAQDLRQAPDFPLGSIHLQKSITTSPAANSRTINSAEAGVIRARATGGIDVTVPNATDEIHMERDDGGNLSKVSLGAEQVVTRRSDGGESVVIDTATGNISTGSVTASGAINAGSISTSGGVTSTTMTASALNANTILRQNRLYLSGAVGGSSLTYNAHRNEANTDWVFPDPSHPAVTVEMDDAGGKPRFQVWSTTTGNTTGWVQRLAINGDTGDVLMAHNGGNVGIGHANPRTQLHVLGRIATGLDFNSAGAITFFPPDGFAWFHIDNGPAGGRPIGRLRISHGGNPGDHELLSIDQNSNVNIPGNLRVNGQKNFVQNHPTDPTKEIVYATLEGGEAGTYIRGTAALVNGRAVIELPEHFGHVTSEEGLTIQLTPRGEWLQLYVVQLTTRQLVVQEAQGKSGQFDYLIQGVRKGYEHYEVIREKAATDS